VHIVTNDDDVVNYWNVPSSQARTSSRLVDSGNYWDNYSDPGTGFSATCDDDVVPFGICDDEYNASANNTDGCAY